MLKATSSIVNVSQITGVLPVVNGGTGVTTSTGTGNTVLSAAPTLSGNVTLSTGNLIVANGQGIDFSATPGTGTSELLADYEQGTWTPTDASGAGLTLTSVSGVYTKIGNTVYFNCIAQYPVTVDASLFKIGSLPFTPNRDGGASVGYTTYATAGALFVQVSNAVNGLRLLTTNGAFLTNADMSGAVITITGTFTTN